jgi:hypothetical protein
MTNHDMLELIIQESGHALAKHRVLGTVTVERIDEEAPDRCWGRSSALFCSTVLACMSILDLSDIRAPEEEAERPRTITAKRMDGSTFDVPLEPVATPPPSEMASIMDMARERLVQGFLEDLSAGGRFARFGYLPWHPRHEMLHGKWAAAEAQPWPGITNIDPSDNR